jgi:hypothetical protein
MASGIAVLCGGRSRRRLPRGGGAGLDLRRQFRPYRAHRAGLAAGSARGDIYARSTNEVFLLAGASLADYELGNEIESRRALDNLVTRFAHTAAFQIAEVYAWRGARDRAFEWLERARLQRDRGLVNVKVDRLLGKLRSDARHAALLRRVNLPVD